MGIVVAQAASQTETFRMSAMLRLLIENREQVYAPSAFLLQRLQPRAEHIEEAFAGHLWDRFAYSASRVTGTETRLMRLAGALTKAEQREDLTAPVQLWGILRLAYGEAAMTQALIQHTLHKQLDVGERARQLTRQVGHRILAETIVQRAARALAKFDDSPMAMASMPRLGMFQDVGGALERIFAGHAEAFVAAMVAE